METAPKSKYWLDIVTAEIMAARPNGPLVVSTGHSPSGNYHIGFLREVLIASAITTQLREQGREATHLDYVDDFDVLRKIPANVSPDFERYLGQPLYLVPDPFGDCHTSYADHFLGGLYDALAHLGIDFTSVRSHQEYQRGRFVSSIEASLTKLDDVKRIISDVSQRQLGADWVPVQILSDEKSLRQWRYTGWDKAKQTVSYRGEDGSEGTVSYAEGRVKLDWRLDWPARWALWKVDVEPFGRDHASKGGSYDTGKELVAQIFGGTAPYPVPYEFVNLQGQTKKMSKSAGNVMTPLEALEVVPPEIIRYFFAKARPAKVLYFDPGIGLYQLIDEYSKVEAATGADQLHDFTAAYKVASSISAESQTVSTVPFSHLVTVFQAAQGDRKRVLELLARTGYGEAVKSQSQVIEAELEYVKNWLDGYAPPEVKFSLQESLPKVELSDTQTKFLAELAGRLETMAPDAQAIHDCIYELKEALGLEPAAAFTAIYRVLIDQDQGPRAGLFVATITELKGKDWLAGRFRLQS